MDPKVLRLNIFIMTLITPNNSNEEILTVAGHMSNPGVSSRLSIMQLCVHVLAAGATRAVWCTMHAGIDSDSDNDNGCQRGASSRHCQ